MCELFGFSGREAAELRPYLQRPLDFGFDIVVESATKYLGGHSDLLAGLLVTGTQELADRVKVIRNFTGGILNPFDAWLLLRGIKTLAVRMDRHQSNTAYLAEYLREHPAVKKIYYPGFSDFPGYAVPPRHVQAERLTLDVFDDCESCPLFSPIRSDLITCLAIRGVLKKSFVDTIIAHGFHAGV